MRSALVELTSLVQFSLNGIALGSVIALAAIGLTLVYGILNLPNFAHGDLLTAGAYLTLLFVAADRLADGARLYAAIVAVTLLGLATLDHLRSRRLEPTDRGLLVVVAAVLLALVLGDMDGLRWGTGLRVLVPATLAAATAGALLGDAPRRWRVAAAAGAVAGGLAGLAPWSMLTQGVLDPLDAGMARLVLVLGGAVVGAVVAAGAAIGLHRGLDVALADARRPYHTLLVGGGLAAVAGAWLTGSRFFLAIALAMAGVALLAAGFELAVWRPLRQGRLAPATHALLGGFLGIVVGLVVTAALDVTATARVLTNVAFAAAGALASWRFLGDRPVAKANLVTYIVASIGVAFAIRFTVELWFTPGLQAFPSAGVRVTPILGVIVPLYQRVTIITTIVVLALVWLLLTRSRFGKAVRALADNIDLAQVTGIHVDRVILKVWLLAGALTGLAGVLLALNAGTFTPQLGFRLLLLLFSAVILGGIGSVTGSLVGAYAIGLTTELSVLLLDARYKFAAAFLVLIIILLVRPQGFFGVAER